MSGEQTCPDCGSTLPTDAPRGLCPQCLMGAALGRPSAGAADATAAHAREPGVLETIAQSIGSVPRVLLRDTNPGEEPGPVVRPDAAPEDASLRYRIDGEIARGGMGAVLKGRDPDLGRDVALKVLREDLRGDADLVRRFVEEAQIGGQLQHPGIVPIYELGTFADRRPFFSMKLVKGHTLAELLAARKDPADGLPRFLGIFEQVCQTVAYAHARGVIHRDLKPSNVMVGSFGEVQVMDWGLAKVLPRGGVADDAAAGKTRDETVIATARSGSDSGADLSRAGSAMGTPSYMAPEQARGEVDLIDERADVFALGSILCEVLSGRPAFVGRTSGEIQRRAARGETADALARLDASGVEAELVALARDCLAAEPEDRPGDASAVAGRVTAYLSGVQERLRATEVARAAEAARAEESKRTAEAAEARARAERGARRLTVALAASLLGLVTLGGGGYAYWARQKADREAAAVAAVERAMEDASARFGQARGAGGDPALWAEARAAAALAAKEADRAEIPGALRRRVRDLVDEVERLDKNRRFVATLLGIYQGSKDTRNFLQNLAETEAKYRQAFRDYGMDLAWVPPGEAAATLRKLGGEVAVELAAALDDWSWARQFASGIRLGDPAENARLKAAGEGLPAGGAWLMEITRILDPDPERNRIRDAVTRKDLPALTALADTLDPATTPRETVVLLMFNLIYGSRESQEAGHRLLKRAQPHHVSDFLINHNLARMTAARGFKNDPAGALPYFMAALALRPQSASTWGNMASSLSRLNRLAEAAFAHEQVVRLTPIEWPDLLQAAVDLEDAGQPDQAAVAYRRAAAAALEHPTTNGGNLIPGASRRRRGLPDEVLARLRQQAAARPTAATRATLALFLQAAGLSDEAAREHIEALRLLLPDIPGARSLLGQALMQQGNYDEAVFHLRRALEMEGPDSPQAARAHLSDLIRQAEKLQAAASRLPAVLKGEDRPRDNADRLALALVGYDTKRYAVAARLWSEALASDPKLADDLTNAHRYNAACAAALAGCGQGLDAPADDDARAALRCQALSWLRAELALRVKQLEQLEGKPGRFGALTALDHWRQDLDLAGVRDAAELAKLPGAERKEWVALWEEVTSLLGPQKRKAP